MRFLRKEKFSSTWKHQAHAAAPLRSAPQTLALTPHDQISWFLEIKRILKNPA